MGQTSAKINMNENLASDNTQIENGSHNVSIAQVYIFRKEECLGWDCFYKDTISIGSGTNADIRLDEKELAEIHAHINIADGKIIVTPHNGTQSIHVNGKPVASGVLGPFDFITVGSHSIKVKLPKLSKASLEIDNQAQPAEDLEEASSTATDPEYRAEASAVACEIEDESPHQPDASETEPIQETKDNLPYTPNFLLVSNLSDMTNSDDAQIDEPSDSETISSLQMLVSQEDKYEVKETVYEQDASSDIDDDDQNGTDDTVSDFLTAEENTITDISATERLDDVAVQNEPEKISVEDIFCDTEGFVEADEPAVNKDDTLPINEINQFIEEEIEASPNEAVQNSASEYRIVFSGKCYGDYETSEVKTALTDLLNLNTKKLERLFSGQRVIVKKNIDYETAEKYQNIFENAGAICTIELLTDGDDVADKDTDKTEYENSESSSYEIKGLNEDTTDAHRIASDRDRDADSFEFRQTPIEVYWEDAEEDEDYDDNPMPFLKEVLTDANLEKGQSSQKDISVEILKLKDNNIIDVRFLNPSEKYFIYNQNGRFCLAEYKNSKKCYVYLDGRLKGHVQPEGADIIGLDRYKTPENVYKKNKGIYRAALDDSNQFSLSDEDYTYLVRKVVRTESPEVAEQEKQKNPFYKNLLRSSGFHLLVMFIFGLAGLFPDMPEPKGPDSHFVKIDVAQLKKEPPPVVKPKPKEKPPEVRPTTTELAKVTKPQKRTKPKKRSGGVSSHPNAGGGSGKDGNVLNRNVNETGILGMIGDSIGFTPKEALATVTNLDVVASPVSGGKTMKVGGIAGKLSTDEISIPTGGVVRSKGTHQVLRSVGVAGEGTVAALKKGKTGQKNVMGMVSVDLDKSVRVQGGMSREAVKKVIDQHLDEISFCYENALMDSPALMGNIVFEWKILLSGKVGEVRIKSSSIRSKEIHSCIKAAIKTWQFPQPTNAEVVVSYPFVFNIVGF